MNIAGPEDERPGDEEGIRYFDFPDLPGRSQREAGTDPFALEGPTDAHEKPSADRPQPTARAPKRPTSTPEEALEPIDPFEFALVGVPLRHAVAPEQHHWEQDLLDTKTDEQSSETGEEHSAPVRFFELASLFAPPDSDTASRERFAAAFDTARAERGAPFLAIALRMGPHTPASVHFPIVADGVRSALRPGDVLLADKQRLRLVAVLHARRDDEAQAVFAHLAAHLRMWLDDADSVLGAISALAAPDGRPFESADTFLARTFDRD